MSNFLSIKKFSLAVLGFYDYYLIMSLCKQYNIKPYKLPERKYPRFHISQVDALLEAINKEHQNENSNLRGKNDNSELLQVLQSKNRSN